MLTRDQLLLLLLLLPLPPPLVFCMGNPQVLPIFYFKNYTDTDSISQPFESNTRKALNQLSQRTIYENVIRYIFS